MEERHGWVLATFLQRLVAHLIDTVRRGQTPGKQVVGKERQAVHDKMIGTLVVQDRL